MVRLTSKSWDDFDPATNVIVLLRDGAQALSLALDDCLVINEPLDVVCGSVLDLYPEKPIKAYYVAAERLAAAATIVASGGKHAESKLETIEVPGLGTVTRDAFIHQDRRMTQVDTSPLAMYENVVPIAGTSAWWPWSIFTFNTTARSQLVPPEIDMTGRARVMVFGPRFSLPAGNWKIRVRFTVDPEDSHVVLRFQWGTGTDLADLTTTLDQPGAYEVEITKAWNMPGLAELRVWAATGHFMGSLTFLGTEVELLEPIRVTRPTVAALSGIID